MFQNKNRNVCSISCARQQRKHRSITAVLCVHFPNDLTTEVDVLDDRDFAIFEFKIRFGRMLHITQNLSSWRSLCVYVVNWCASHNMMLIISRSTYQDMSLMWMRSKGCYNYFYTTPGWIHAQGVLNRWIILFCAILICHNIPNCMKEVTWLMLCLSTNGHRSAGLGWLPFI